MAEILRKKINEHTLLAVWEITEPLEELESGIILRPGEFDLYEKFRVGNRKKQWLAYRLLIKSMLAPEDYAVEYDQTGKPYLAGSKYHISVTHSGVLASVIMSSSGPVGIDIEMIGDRITKVKDKFLHPTELEMLGNEDVNARLTLAWCAKESLYKLFGNRGLDFRENLRIELPDNIYSGQFSGQVRMQGSAFYYTLHYERFESYMLVYVADPSSGP